jgi:ribose 5-phosphate isomerase B
MFTGGEQIPFYEIAASVARKVQDGEAERAILCCGTGMGVAIVANKFKGVYAGVVESEFGGRHCKVINNCNVLTMGAWVVPPYQATRIVDLYLDSPFTKGYEGIRGFLENACIEVGKIENETMK